VSEPVPTLVLRQAEVEGELVDVRVEGARISALGPPGTVAGADVEIECAGGALLPGLHDHHLHLLSMAAVAGSVDVSTDLDQRLRQAHRTARPEQPLRAVHYDEAIEGHLDRWRLDALAPGRAVRVQHRSGALWVLSTAALEQVGALESTDVELERDDDGRPTGRLFRLDWWLQERLPPSAPIDLGPVGRRLAAFGVTGVTDCTPAATAEYFATLAGAVNDGTLPLTVAVTGAPELAATGPPPSPLRRGPAKIVIPDHELPAFEDLRASFQTAHRAGLPVAVHCVTRAALLLALAVWREVGSAPGDRIEHASVTPVEVIAEMAALALTVVTQPAFVAARGDAYLRQVEPGDRGDLYRCASFLEGGVAVGGSTDAPFGPDDPWLAVQAAIERRAASGLPVGADHGLDAAQASALFLAPLENPGGPIRRVTVGAPADLCLLDVPRLTALGAPSSRHVAATVAGGRCSYLA
jgi:predicted amidohydrolase YtcJ